MVDIGGGGRGRPRQHRAGTAPSPALLTSHIKKAWTVDDLFTTWDDHGRGFNHIHISAFWNKLGHLTRGADNRWGDRHAEGLKSLAERTADLAITSPAIQARQLANIAHGVVKSGQGGNLAPLMSALAKSMKGRVGECNAQELANTAWAFAKTGNKQDTELFAELATAAGPFLSNFNAQELTNTAWAFATANHADAELFAELGKVVGRRLQDFSAQGLSNSAWAFARAGHVDAQLFAAVAEAVQQRLRDFNSQDIANTAWAFAKAGQYDAQLFSSMARSVERHLDSFTAQGLANTAWAFAKAGHMGSDLFTSLAGRIQQCLDDFNPQDLASTAWAFAKACHPDERLFSAFARLAEQCVSEFNTQDLVNTAWAFAKVGQPGSAPLFAAVAREIGDDLNANQIANLAWAYARAGQLDGGLFASLARSAQQRVGELNAQDLANVAWAFANAGQLGDTQLFGALAAAAEGMLDDFEEEDLDNAEWAFAKAGQHKVARCLRQRRSRRPQAFAPTLLVSAATSPAVDVSACGLIVVAGGGIGGAAAAVALQAQGFEVVVLEADTSFDARAQGYGLTIQQQDATRSLGVSLAADDAPSTSHYTFSSDGAIVNFYGEAFGGKSRQRQEAEDSGRFVHIPRQALRARLVERVAPGSIRWGSRLKDFRCSGGDSDGGKNRVTVTLMDGSTIEAALLVGSDGIFSTVRRQLRLPGDRLNYVGFVVVLGIVDGSVMEVPLAHRRVFETVDGSTRVYAMPFTTSSSMWQLSFPCDQDRAKAFAKDPKALKLEILRLCEGWHDPIPSLLRNTPLDCMSGYPVYDRELLDPKALRDPSAPPRRVTLIGDAAHPMTPFRAQGANQALADAVLLAETLAESVKAHGPAGGLDAALPVFERKMLSRSARAVVASREKAKELHSSLALQPARKAQREARIDMQAAIKRLRASGVGAQCATTDPRGLDAAVAEAAGLWSVNSPTQRQGGGGGAAMEKKRKAVTEGKNKERGRAQVAVDPVVDTKETMETPDHIGKKKKTTKTPKERSCQSAPVVVAKSASGEEKRRASSTKARQRQQVLEALTLKLLTGRDGRARSMPRRKLRKKVLLALEAAGVTMAKKAAVRSEWEEMIRASSRFTTTGDTVSAS